MCAYTYARILLFRSRPMPDSHIVISLFFSLSFNANRRVCVCMCLSLSLVNLAPPSPADGISFVLRGSPRGRGRSPFRSDRSPGWLSGPPRGPPLPSVFVFVPMTFPRTTLLLRRRRGRRVARRDSRKSGIARARAPEGHPPG